MQFLRCLNWASAPRLRSHGRMKTFCMLNFFEELGLLVNRLRLDEEYLRGYFGSLVLTSYILLEPFVKQVRVNNPTAYIEFETLAERWRPGN